MDITRILPEECLCLIISLTSPVDACGSAMVSHALRSVADCDAVWEKFLPSDYKSIISGSSSSSLLSLGKKDLYFHLCFHPVLIQNGTMSFQLKKESGKKCYMLGARALSIIWGDTPSYWTWKSLPESRFSEVAELKLVWWLEVKGMIDVRILSSNTNYAAYLVFKLRNRRTIGFRHRAVGLHINVGGITSREVRRVSLDPSQNETQHVREREDGWMEVEMGEFFNEFGDDGTVQLSLREVDTSYFKQGLIIEGIELRPKNTGS
ncbi:F-box protein [Gossypium australe]|uniref:F-box protein n=1 Tax=Gossypium australe TaxID=47621 RepID=A0A5B6UEW3_9ROSI|nr:F-box protein [Gossypium australe]